MRVYCDVSIGKGCGFYCIVVIDSRVATVIKRPINPSTQTLSAELRCVQKAKKMFPQGTLYTDNTRVAEQEGVILINSEENIARRAIRRIRKCGTYKLDIGKLKSWQ